MGSVAEGQEFFATGVEPLCCFRDRSRVRFMAENGWNSEWQFLLPRVGLAAAQSDQKVNKLLLFRHDW
ncbi:MAG: hypothetical protein ACKOC1_10375 [Hyphomicrobiales bacterium]